MGFFDLFKRQARTKPSESIMQTWVQEWEKRQGVPQPRKFAEELASYSNYVWAWACGKLVADSLTTLPLRFWRKGGEQLQEITSGPLVELFEYANDYSTLGNLLFITSLDLQFCGNAYWHLGTAEGPVEKLERIPPQRLKPKPGDDRRIESWLLTTSATNQRLEAGEVLHFKQPDPNNDIYGIGAAAGGALSIDTDRAAAETNKDLLERDIRIGGILNVKGRIQTAEERRAIAKRFEQEHGGRGPGKRVLVMDAEEAVFVPTQFTLRDMEFSVLRRMLREEVCAAFGVPPIMVGILDRATYCLPADSRIAGPDGIKSIAEVRPGDRVWAYDDGALAPAVVQKAGRTGHKQLFEVRTRNRILRATDNHPVLVRIGSPQNGPNHTRQACYEWREVGQLQRGDKLVQPTCWPDQGGTSLPDGTEATADMMQFLGALVGDGTVDAGAVRLSIPIDDRVGPFYRRLAAQLFTKQAHQTGGDLSQQAKVPRVGAVLQEVRNGFAFRSAGEARRLAAWGFDGRAKTKRIPGWVYGLRRELKLAFLAGIVDTDGHIDRRGYLAVGFANEALVQDVKDLLQSIGCAASNPAYRKQFAAGLPNAGLQESYDFWSITASSAVNVAQIPFADSLYRARVDQNHSRHRPVGSGAAAKRNRKLSGLACFTVRSIRPLDCEDVYDLTVEGHHSFVADGIVVHNSNYGQSLQAFWGETMQAHARLVAGSLTEFLLPRYGSGLYAEFDFSGVDALQDSNLDERIVALKEIELGVLGEAEYRSLWYPDLTGPPPEPKPVPAPLAKTPSEEPFGEESGVVPFGQRRLSPRGSGATRFGGPSTPPPGNGKSASGDLLKSLFEKAPP